MQHTDEINLLKRMETDTAWKERLDTRRGRSPQQVASKKDKSASASASASAFVSTPVAASAPPLEYSVSPMALAPANFSAGRDKIVDHVNDDHDKDETKDETKYETKGETNFTNIEIGLRALSIGFMIYICVFLNDNSGGNIVSEAVSSCNISADSANTVQISSLVNAITHSVFLPCVSALSVCQVLLMLWRYASLPIRGKLVLDLVTTFIWTVLTFLLLWILLIYTFPVTIADIEIYYTLYSLKETAASLGICDLDSSAIVYVMVATICVFVIGILLSFFTATQYIASLVKGEDTKTRGFQKVPECEAYTMV